MSAYWTLIRTIAALFMLSCSGLSAATVTGNATDFTGTASRIPFDFRWLSGPAVEAAKLVVGERKIVQTAADGSFSVELKGGDYQVSVPGVRSFTISVPAGDSATYNIIALITSSLTYTYTGVPVQAPQALSVDFIGPNGNPTNTVSPVSLSTFNFGVLATPAGGVTIEPGTYNVLSYGATGDGTTDDKAAIQAAIDAAEAAGGTVYFPSSTYNIQSGLLVNGSNVRLAGTGSGSILLAGADFLTTNQLCQVVGNNISIENLQFDGDLRANRAITIGDSATNIVVRSVEIKDVAAKAGEASTTAAIRIAGAVDGVKVTDCFIHDIDATLGTGISRAIWAASATQSYDMLFQGNTISDIEPQADGDGIHIQTYTGSVNARIVDNYFVRCRKRAVKAQSPGILIKGNTIVCDYPDLVDAMRNGISVYSDDVSVIGNTISGGSFTTSAIELGVANTALDNVVVQGNQIFTDGVADITTCDGIVVYGSAVTAVIINGNSIKTWRNGIQVLAGLTESIISANYINGAVNAGIRWDDDATGGQDPTRNLVFGNHIVNNTGAPIAIINDDESRFDGNYWDYGAGGISVTGGDPWIGSNGDMKMEWFSASGSLGADNDIGLWDMSAVRNVTLPDATLMRGKKLTVKDNTGQSDDNPITLLTTSGQTIDGFASGGLKINHDWGAQEFISDGTNWLRLNYNQPFYTNGIGSVLFGPPKNWQALNISQSVGTNFVAIHSSDFTDTKAFTMFNNDGTTNRRAFYMLDGVNGAAVLGNTYSTGGDFPIQIKVGSTVVGQFDGSATANDTRFLIYDVTAGTLQRVTIGASDSGGVGYRVLRIPN